MGLYAGINKKGEVCEVDAVNVQYLCCVSVSTCFEARASSSGRYTDPSLLTCSSKITVKKTNWDETGNMPTKDPSKSPVYLGDL